MHRENKKTKIILVVCLSLLLCLSVGYAAFQTSFNVKGSTAITGNWNIEVTNVAVAETEGSGENAKTPIWTQTTANMEANLYEPGDSVKYIVTIQNKGNIDAKLENIITNGETNNAISIQTAGYNIGETLKQGQTKQITVEIAYNPDYDGTETSSEAQIVIEYVQATNSN